MIKSKQLNMTTLFKVMTNHALKLSWLLQLQYSMVTSTNITNSYYDQNFGSSELQTK